MRMAIAASTWYIDCSPEASPCVGKLLFSATACTVLLGFVESNADSRGSSACRREDGLPGLAECCRHRAIANAASQRSERVALGWLLATRSCNSSRNRHSCW